MFTESFDQVSNRSGYLADCQNNTIVVDDFVHINQTETLRIVGELNRWIGRGKTLNWTHNVPRKKTIEDKDRGKV